MSATVPPGTTTSGARVLTAAALVAIYMQAFNVSLPNAALPYLQGTLQMADDEVGWVFTAYLAASAVTIPLTRWLVGCFGRRTVFLVSLAGFALGLLFDVAATTPLQFVFARIFQGAASGPLGPLSMAIMLDVLPPARHPRVNLMGAITGLLGISTGASIGGWFSEFHGWHSIFYLSLPLTGFIFLAVALWLPEKRPAQNPPFDFLGWGSFSLGLSGLQIVLDAGERLEWFDSPVIWAAAIGSGLGFYLFVVHVLTADSHFLDKALFKDRNFVLSTIMVFAVGFVLLPTLALTSPMLEELLGYPVHTTGYMTLPRGIGLVGALVLMAYVPARIDSRLIAIFGMSLVAYANWRMARYSPLMDWRAVAIAGLLQGLGLGITLPALTKTAFVTLDPKFRPEGAALFGLSRVYGSTIAIAIVQVFFYNNTQAVHLALAKGLTPFRAAAHVSGAMSVHGLAALNEMVTGQAAFVGVIDQFKILTIAALVAIPLALALRKPHTIAAERAK